MDKNIDRDEYLKRMFKLMMERLMEGERDAFLGYSKYDRRPNNGFDNSRNGYYSRDLLTGLGNLNDLEIPRDRNGQFDTELLRRFEQSTTPMDRLILKLYSKGMSTRDIQDTIEEIYGKKLSPAAVSEITGEIEEERIAWEKRPLKKRYTAIFIDALFVKLRRDNVAADAVYIAAAIDNTGKRDILGQYVSGEESATFWKGILADFKARGVKEVLLFVFDGLTGLKEAVNEIYPKSLTQLCVIHQVRNTLSYVRHAHKEAVAADLKSIYKNPSLSAAKEQLLKVKAKWMAHYSRLFNRWIDKIELLMTFLEFPEYLRPLLYSTNWLERLNKEFRKVVKTKNSFPTETAVRNVIYFKIKDISRRWDSQSLNGFVAFNADLQILWERHYGRKEEFTQSI